MEGPVYCFYVFLRSPSTSKHFCDHPFVLGPSRCPSSRIALSNVLRRIENGSRVSCNVGILYISVSWSEAVGDFHAIILLLSSTILPRIRVARSIHSVCHNESSHKETCPTVSSENERTMKRLIEYLVNRSPKQLRTRAVSSAFVIVWGALAISILRVHSAVQYDLTPLICD